MDPFEALGLPRSWPVDPLEVRSAQRRLTASWHPDRFPDPAQRSGAQERLAQVNEAAARLLDPLGSAQALLEVLAPSPRPAEPKPAPTFLAAMMEIREAIDGGGDHAAALAEVAALRAQAEADARGAFTALAAGSQAAWNAAAEAVGRLRALRRAEEGAAA
jgi:curved DNA-binding protein CbpA